MPYFLSIIGIRMTAEEFKQARERMRLTQKDLASRLDVTETTIYRYETGVNPIPRTVELALKQIRRELVEADSQDLE